MGQGNCQSEDGQQDQSGARSDYVVEESAWRVCDMPQRMRPREEMSRLGTANVSDDVLLAIILRSGVKGANVIDLARGLLRNYGSLTALASAPVEEITESVKGMGKVKSQVLAAALELARRLNEEAAPERYRIKTPEDAARLLRDKARLLDKEVFWVLRVDTKNQLKGRPVDVTNGLLDASLVHPREVFREAIRSATAAVVLAHNHPSGDPAPSAEDLRVTRQLVDAGRVVDIKVLDHVIVGKASTSGARDFYSMREEGVIEFG